MKTLLNVGCGHSNISKIKGFNAENWKEIRLDIDQSVKPDIVGFTYSVLNQSFGEAGFPARYGGRFPINGGELGLVAFKQKKSEDEIKNIADPFLF